ncbi:hypothetical protein ACIGXM_29955 [Kitasatospora sp. NPDC052896]|uniref:hypothetical protein n=1 Tax=Kitasatospora sp. NPDC052896 TaxID=3364061 RepID=UPI0037CB9873
MPQVAVAALFNVHPGTVNRRIRDVRGLLTQAGHTLQPADLQLADLNDLYTLANTAGIPVASEIKTAS